MSSKIDKIQRWKSTWPPPGDDTQSAAASDQGGQKSEQTEESQGVLDYGLLKGVTRYKFARACARKLPINMDFLRRIHTCCRFVLLLLHMGHRGMVRVYPETGEEPSSVVSTSAMRISYTCTTRFGILSTVCLRLGVVAIIRRILRFCQ